MFCPIKTSPEYKEMQSVLGTDLATAVWYENKGNPVWQTPKGADSKLFASMENAYGRDNAIFEKSSLYTNSYRTRNGDWVNDPKSFKGNLNSQGEPDINIEPLSKEEKTMLNAMNKYDNLPNEKLINRAKAKRNVITKTLNDLGIAVGSLTYLEEKEGLKGNDLNGIFDPTSQEKNADGLIEMIRIAQDDRGDVALPEEFGHFLWYALRDDPLMKPFNQVLDNDLLLKEIFEDSRPGSFEQYRDIYNDDRKKLIAEAAGKIFSKVIVNGQPNKISILNRFLEGFKRVFKRIFGKGDVNNIKKQLYDVENEFGKLASSVLDGQMKLNINWDTLKNADILASIGDSIKDNKAILKEIIEKQHKIIHRYRRKHSELSDYMRERDINLIDLEEKYSKQMYDDGIADALRQMVVDFQSLNNNISKLNIKDGAPTSDINKTAAVLRDMRSYVDAYAGVLQSIITYYNDPNLANDNVSKNNVALTHRLFGMIADLNSTYERAAYPLVGSFLNEYTSLNTPELITMLQAADQDISLVERWLQALANSGDELLRILDQPVKDANANMRRTTNEDDAVLRQALINLEKAGYINTDFVFKKIKGKMTGYFVQPIDWGGFYHALSNKKKELLSIYDIENSTIDNSRYYAELKDWYLKNTIKGEDDMMPNPDIYEDADYKALSPQQKKFLDIILAKKIEKDKLLPPKRVKKGLAPQRRKHFIDRVKAADGDPSRIWKHVKENIKEQWEIVEDDTEFGDKKGAIVDFNNRQILSIPVYFVDKMERENENGDMVFDDENFSTDVIGSMIKYCEMANNYHEFNKIIDVMELARDLIREREIGVKKNGNQLTEIISRFGRKIESKVSKPSGESLMMERLDEYFKSNIYGMAKADEGTWGKSKVSKAKTADNLNRLVSLTTYAGNALASVTNVLMGRIQLRTEAAAGEFIKHKDLTFADKIYFQNLPEMVAEAGNRIKRNKLELVARKYNLLQDFKKRSSEADMNKRTWFTRFFNLSTAYVVTGVGEDYLQYKSGLALMSAQKLKDKSGREITLYDAYEKYNDKDGVTRVRLKDGVTKLDGTPWTEKDENKFDKKARAFKQRMDGIYNSEDSNAAQRYGAGRLAFMFRNWLISMANRRFQKNMYNYDLDAETSGFYNTFLKFTKEIMKDIPQMKLDLLGAYKNLSAHEQANMNRALTELMIFFACWLAYAMLSHGLDDDDDETWLHSYARYQSRRLASEIGVLVPTGITQIQEGLTMIKSPIAATNTLSNIVRMANVFDWFEEVEQGRHKGRYKVTKNIISLTPMVNPVYRALHPEDAIKLYNLFN